VVDEHVCLPTFREFQESNNVPLGVKPRIDWRKDLVQLAPGFPLAHYAHHAEHGGFMSPVDAVVSSDFIFQPTPHPNRILRSTL
jgi:hypothetical protein